MNLLILTQKVDKDDDNLGFFHEWLRKFAEKTKKVFVVANFVGEHSLPANAQIFSLGKERKLGRIRRYFNFYKYLFKTLPRADAVLVHMIPVWAILVWPAAFVLRKKIYLWYTHKSVTFSLRLAEKLSAKIFTASPESCRLNSKKIIITGHGIDINRFAPKNISDNSSRLKLLSVGRIAPAKGLKFLLDVLFQLKKQSGRNNFILDIVGGPVTGEDFSYQKELEKIIEEKNLRTNVKFLGPKTYAEMPDIYNSHDVLLHASETGSLDKVVLEAMACGLPVISTSRQAFKGIMPDNAFADNKNAATMAQKIIIAMNQKKGPSLRETIIKNHNLNNLIDRILANL